MDLLFSKYASPYFLLDGYIQTGRFTEFVCEFLDLNAKEQEEQHLWELYLHRVFDKSFNEFRESVTKPERMTEAQLETTIQNSSNMLNNFIPEERG